MTDAVTELCLRIISKGVDAALKEFIDNQRKPLDFREVVNELKREAAQEESPHVW